MHKAMVNLTQRQQEVLRFIDRTQRRHGTAPSLREMADHFGFHSVNAARDHVEALCRKGLLRRRPGRARSYQVATPLRRLRKEVADVPLLGNVPAGFADARNEAAVGCVSVDVDTLGIRPTPRTFALRVRGDSMEGRHILDGDVVVCEHGLEPRPGDVVAALIDNESTLKTFVKEGRKTYLRAENPKYPDLVPAAELVIQGVVVSVLRRCR
jgi:repressor LexA